MANKTSKIIKKIEYIFEALIWNFRFFIIALVIFSLLSALRFIIIGTVDIWAGLTYPFNVQDPEGEATIKIVGYINNLPIKMMNNC